MRTTPDQWVVVKLDNGTPEEVIYKVFASWMGGYTTGDAWKLNSGITEVIDEEHSFVFAGHSGSQYQCTKGAYGTGTSYSTNILTSIVEHGSKINVAITVMPADTDWVKLFSK